VDFERVGRKPAILQLVSRARVALWWGFSWRGLVWGTVAGGVAGAIYGGLLLAITDDAGFFGDEAFEVGAWAGMFFGAFAGAGLGTVSALVIATLTARRPPTERASYVRFVRLAAASLPVLVGAILTVGAVVDQSTWTGFGSSLLIYFLPGLIAGAIGWLLAPRAVRRYLDIVLPVPSEAPART
jgi:hypothetical protein